MSFLPTSSRLHRPLSAPPSPPRVGEECSGKEEHEDGEELAFGQAADHGRVGFTELFAEDAECGVKREEQSSQESVGGLGETGADLPQDGEEQQAL